MPPQRPSRAQPMARATVPPARVLQPGQAAARDGGSTSSTNSGGPGGNASSNATVINVPNAFVSSTANGGTGGSCFAGCTGGNGGSATAGAIGIAFGQATVSATATGGTGGTGGNGFIIPASSGGSATLSAFGSSEPGGTVTSIWYRDWRYGWCSAGQPSPPQGRVTAHLSAYSPTLTARQAAHSTSPKRQSGVTPAEPLKSPRATAAVLLGLPQAYSLERTPLAPQPIILLPLQLAGKPAGRFEVVTHSQRLTGVLPRLA